MTCRILIRVLILTGAVLAAPVIAFSEAYQGGELTQPDFYSCASETGKCIRISSGSGSKSAVSQVLVLEDIQYRVHTRNKETIENGTGIRAVIDFGLNRVVITTKLKGGDFEEKVFPLATLKPKTYKVGS